MLYVPIIRNRFGFAGRPRNRIQPVYYRALMRGAFMPFGNWGNDYLFDNNAAQVQHEPLDYGKSKSEKEPIATHHHQVK